MLASLLPGIRELRAPLAAGYIWLAFLYLVFGTPDTLADLPDPLEALVGEIDSFGPAATAVAASFVAYLVGSISQDAFGRFLPAGLELVANRFPRRDEAGEYLAYTLAEFDFAAKRILSRELADSDLQDNRRLALVSAERANQLLGEMRAAGASESEKPEALRPMIEAEENLRTSIVPPLAALSAAVAWSAPLVGVVGLIFSLVLYAQAAARRIEARQLARLYRWSSDLEEAQVRLSQAADLLEFDGPLPPEQLHALGETIGKLRESRAAAGLIGRAGRPEPLL
jgi:hypothetical protein